MIENSYYTLVDERSYEIEEKKSRFISFSKIVNSEQDAKVFIANIKAKHPSATHVCHAYILGENSNNSHSSDDGEPSGSAGLPIFEALRKNKLTNSLIVVVRYFGGTELGISGLYRAYHKAALEIIKRSGFFTMTECFVYEFRFTYNDFSKVASYIKENNLPILKQDYSDFVRIEIALPTHNEQLYFNDIKTMIGGRFMNAKLKSEFIRFGNEK